MNNQDQIRFKQLYERNLTELTLHGKCKKSIEISSRCLRRLVEFFDTCPDSVTTE